MESIPLEHAEELSYGASIAPVEYVSRQFVSEHRWYNRFLIVFTHDGDLDLYYGFYYDEPATELQEGQDDAYHILDNGEVKVYPVIAEPITKTVYKVVE